MLARGAVAWAEIECVVGVDSISYGCKSALSRQVIQHREKLVLTKIAAFRIVCGIAWIGQFLCFKKLLLNTGGASERLDLLTIVRGKTGGNRGHGQRPPTQRQMRRPC